MENCLVRWRRRYAKVLRDYPELKEASNISIIDSHAGINEQKLQQAITAALICDNPYTYDERNVMSYSLEACDTPSKHNFHSNSQISYGLMVMFVSLRHSYTPFYRAAVERLEQIYFTL